MSKVFEDYFSELQADMVSICLEYVRNRADEIYIYCSHEEGIISSYFFYCINGKIIKKHKLNDALVIANEKAEFVYNTSSERQGTTLKIINSDIEKIIHLCKEYKREMPTEMKLIYDVVKNKLMVDYKYDLVYFNDPIKTANDIALEWFEEIKGENSN